MVRKRFLDHNLGDYSSSSASNFWLKETQLGYFWTIPTQNQYGERVRWQWTWPESNWAKHKIYTTNFTFPEKYMFHFKSQKPCSDGKVDCYKLIPVLKAELNCKFFLRGRWCEEVSFPHHKEMPHCNNLNLWNFIDLPKLNFFTEIKLKGIFLRI